MSLFSVDVLGTRGWTVIGFASLSYVERQIVVSNNMVKFEHSDKALPTLLVTVLKYWIQFAESI